MCTVTMIVAAIKLGHFFQFPHFLPPQAALCLCENTRAWDTVAQVLTRPLAAGL